MFVCDRAALVELDIIEIVLHSGAEHTEQFLCVCSAEGAHAIRTNYNNFCDDDNATAAVRSALAECRSRAFV